MLLVKSTSDSYDGDRWSEFLFHNEEKMTLPLTMNNLLNQITIWKTRNPVWISYVPLSMFVQVENVIGVKRCSDGTMHIYINGEDMGVAASNIPKVSSTSVHITYILCIFFHTCDKKYEFVFNLFLI